MPKDEPFIPALEIGRREFKEALRLHTDVLRRLRTIYDLYCAVPEGAFRELDEPRCTLAIFDGPIPPPPAKLMGHRWSVPRTPEELKKTGYSDLPNDLIHLDPSEKPRILRWINLPSLRKQYPAMGPVAKAIVEWASKCLLRDQWLLDEALVALYRWRSLQRPDDRWGRLPITPPITTPPSRLNCFSDWRPYEESSEVARARMHQELDRWLDEEFIPTVEAEYRAAGWAKRPEVRKPEHTKWAVLWQVGRMSQKAIATKENGEYEKEHGRKLSDDTVLKAVTKILNQVGVTPRTKSVPGFPPENLK